MWREERRLVLIPRAAVAAAPNAAIATAIAAAVAAAVAASTTVSAPARATAPLPCVVDPHVAAKHLDLGCHRRARRSLVDKVHVRVALKLAVAVAEPAPEHETWPGVGTQYFSCSSQRMAWWGKRPRGDGSARTRGARLTWVTPGKGIIASSTSPCPAERGTRPMNTDLPSQRHEPCPPRRRLGRGRMACIQHPQSDAEPPGLLSLACSAGCAPVHRHGRSSGHFRSPPCLHAGRGNHPAGTPLRARALVTRRSKQARLTRPERLGKRRGKHTRGVRKGSDADRNGLKGPDRPVPQ